MRTAPSDTAILLFAHAAEQEAKTKSFSSGRSAQTNKKIARALLEHTLGVLYESQIPLFTVYTAQQKGNTFGERLANAFQDVFEAGYQRVICVGSDCPTLAVSDLLQAQRALQQHSMVIGPAADGGAYLIGMHIGCFDPESFAMLNWQTEQVQQELSIYSFRHQARLHGFVLLQKRADVDTKEDLGLVLEGLPVLNRFKLVILAILSEGAARAYTLRHFLRKPLSWKLQRLQLRAPPH
ncbi:hypothetical protein GCM10023188_33560 [Pontibacter saemangeumensis]|uniref:DUF2064 domain-containing protein n=1 Tax=Pontibacter saemangeumensis TaxID=1084525 RepID=A0ABP8LZI3_9BACT